MLSVSEPFHSIRLSDYLKPNTSVNWQTFRYIITMSQIAHHLYWKKYMTLNNMTEVVAFWIGFSSPGMHLKAIYLSVSSQTFHFRLKPNKWMNGKYLAVYGIYSNVSFAYRAFYENKKKKKKTARKFIQQWAGLRCIQEIKIIFKYRDCRKF